MISTKVDLIDRDIVVSLTQEMSPAGQSAALAEFADEQLANAEQIDGQILGEVPEHDTFVDGAETRSLQNVRPTSIIVFDLDVLTLLVRWIEDQLIAHSPVKTGRYQRSHRVYIDGSEIDITTRISGAVKEVVFAPTVIYARLIEPHGGRPGESKQAPDGVYQVVAAMARRKFLSSAVSVSFGFREVAGVEESGRERRSRSVALSDQRQPAIVIKVT